MLVKWSWWIVVSWSIQLSTFQGNYSLLNHIRLPNILFAQIWSEFMNFQHISILVEWNFIYRKPYPKKEVFLYCFDIREIHVEASMDRQLSESFFRCFYRVQLDRKDFSHSFHFRWRSNDFTMRFVEFNKKIPHVNVKQIFSTIIT